MKISKLRFVMVCPVGEDENEMFLLLGRAFGSIAGELHYSGKELSTSIRNISMPHDPFPDHVKAEITVEFEG